MDNYCRLNNSDFVEIKNDINNQELGKIKNLSQAERRILKLAVESLGAGSPYVIVSQGTGRKLTEASNYDKTICKTISKAIDKVFHKDEYIDFNELSELVNAMSLRQVEVEKELNSPKIVSFDEKAEKQEMKSEKREIERSEVFEPEYVKATKYERRTMRLEEKAARLDAVAERLEKEIIELEKELKRYEKNLDV